MLAEGVAAVAAVAHDPQRRAWQMGKERHGVRQFVGLTRRECEGDRAPRAVSDHECLRPEAPTRAAKRLTLVPLRRCCAFLAAPAALLWARTEVPSRKVMPSPMPRS